MKYQKKLFLKRFSMKIIDLILSNIVQYEKEILAVEYINQKIETKDKWNQVNVLNMESMLVSNCRMPFLHMSKRYICIEETNQRINEFYFVYMMNPTLYKNKAFKEQVKACFRNTFGPDTNSHINTILMKKNTRVLALVIFYESGKTNLRKMSKVLSCVIYRIIDRYVCIDYLGTEKKKISDLKIGCTLSNQTLWYGLQRLIWNTNSK